MQTSPLDPKKGLIGIHRALLIGIPHIGFVGNHVALHMIRFKVLLVSRKYMIEGYSHSGCTGYDSGIDGV